MAFKEISIRNLVYSPIKLIGEDWLLLSAGNEEKYNGMTISWGSFGTIWHKKGSEGQLPTINVYVRPQRYTYELMEENEYFSVCKLKDIYKDMHGILGSKSGRDTDKMNEVGLMPIFEDNTVYYEQAELVMICRKLYTQQLTEEAFVDKDIIDLCYPNKDFHHMYVGEIVKVLVNEQKEG